MYSGTVLAQTPQDIARTLFKSTVVLILEDSGSRPRSLGNGVVVRDGIVVTNYHVIAGSTRGYLKAVNSGTLALDPKQDLALIKTALIPRNL